MKYLLKRQYWINFFSTPFIWIVLIPAVIMHIFIEFYHQVCFRLYGIEMVNIHDYVVFDRQKLKYLSLFDKLNCAYCSYVNGIFLYCSAIGQRTEWYWCGVKHKNQPTNPVFSYQKDFADWADEKAYKKHKNSRY